MKKQSKNNTIENVFYFLLTLGSLLFVGWIIVDSVIFFAAVPLEELYIVLIIISPMIYLYIKNKN